MTNCDACNESLGLVEDEVREALQYTYAAVGARNEEGDPIVARFELDGHEFDVEGAAAFYRSSGVRFNKDSKLLELPLPVGLEKQAELIAAAVHSQRLGLEHVEKLGLAPGVQPALPPSAQSNHKLMFGGEQSHKRFLAKVAVELLAYFRYDLACRPELSELRRYARHGSGSIQVNPDLRSEGSGLIAGELPQLWNGVEVWTFGRSLFFRITFLRHIRFTGSLCTDWTGSAVRAAYAFDAREPSHAVAKTAVDGDGPNLAVFFHRMSVDAGAEAGRELEAANLELAQELALPSRVPAPPIDDLRTAVRFALAKRIARVEAKKAKRRGR